MKLLSIIMIVGSILLMGTGAFFAVNGYIVYKNISACANYVNDPQDAIKGCSEIMDAPSRFMPEDKDFNQQSYKVIWLHLAQVHAGNNDQTQFEKNVKNYVNEKWPAPVLSLYLEKSTPEEVIDQANATTDPAQQNNQVCEATYYIGELYLQQNLKEKAMESFQSARNLCPPNFVEHINAEAILNNNGVM